MKVRLDFVTNSSSSSFIIACKDVDKDFLINTVLKDFYLTIQRQWWADEETDEEILSHYKPDEVLDNKDSSIGVFIRTKAELDDDNDRGYYGWGYKQTLEEEEKNKEKFYEISNNCCVRFNFDIVRKVIEEKYNIPWQYGYCD